MKSRGALSFIILLALSSPAQAQSDNNFADRSAVIINNAPGQIDLFGFSFKNEYRSSSERLITNLSWKNAGSKAITAFEVVALYFDPFNRSMSIGGRWLVTGHDSANWAPLQPGESGSDGLIGFDDSPAFTAIVYVRAIRFADGTVWYSNQTEIEQKVKASIPELKDLGALDPGPKKSEH